MAVLEHEVLSLVKIPELPFAYVALTDIDLHILKVLRLMSKNIFYRDTRQKLSFLHSEDNENFPNALALTMAFAAAGYAEILGKDVGRPEMRLDTMLLPRIWHNTIYRRPLS
jgi:hypothetical protein